MRIRPILPEEIESARLLLAANGRGLRAGRAGLSALYEKLGFSASEVAMERSGKRR